MILRPYQSEACDRVRDAWQRVNSVLVECPTGTGKTVMFAERAATHEAGRVLIVCPAIQLVSQAARKLKQRTGIMPDIEQAVVRGIFYDDKSEEELAQYLGRSVGEVKKFKQKALNDLEKLLTGGDK